MKLLFDENLSYRLVEALIDLFPCSTHVSQVGLTHGIADRQIWDYAKQNGFAVITGDTDFVTWPMRLDHRQKLSSSKIATIPLVRLLD